MDQSAPTKTPYRQIRALYDEETITVYQAYSESIAKAAVKEQRLNASPEFLLTRRTWIKPSWCWMLYRSGYAAKDSRQTRILAIKMTRAHFRQLLSLSSVTQESGTPLTQEQRSKPVRVQWDPERGPRLQKLEYRSIQIGIGREIVEKWVGEWIVGIEDVTDRARELRKLLDQDDQVGRLGKENELVEKGLMPKEVVYEVDEELRRILEMD